MESAQPSGELIIRAGLETLHQAISDHALSGGEQQGSTWQSASLAVANATTELRMPPTPITKTQDANEVEQEDLVRRLAVERESRHELESGREVEQPDDI